MRFYRGICIHDKNVYGMWSARVNDLPYAADTLEGMKRVIRVALGIES